MRKIYTIILISFVLICSCFISCKKTTDVEVVTKQDTITSTTAKPVNLIVHPSLKIIVVVGSSTAAGIGANPIDSSWVGRLKIQMANSKKGKVINLGVGGFSTYDTMPNNFIPGPYRGYPVVNNNITKALSYQPDLVIINLPTNDIAYGYSDTEIINNFKTMTSVMDSLNVPYLLTGTQPRNFTSVDTRKRLKALDDKLRAAFTDHVDDYLDQLSDSTWNIKPEFNSGDGIHVNNKGHNIIYQSVIKFPLFLRLINP